MIAKYYPSNGWYMECLPPDPKQYNLNENNLIEQLELCLSDAKSGSPDAFNQWITEHSHDDHSTWGPAHFHLDFDIGPNSSNNTPPDIVGA